MTGYAVPLSKPDLTQREVEAVANAVKSGWITEGRWHEEAANELATRCKRKYCLLTSSGTAALRAARMSLQWTAQTKIAVPAMCFAGVLQSGPGQHLMMNLDCFWQQQMSSAGSALGISGCIAVDNYGGMPDYDDLLARRYTHCPIIEDAAEAFGATYRNQPAGSFGDISIFSFYANKIVTAGQGGALLTDDSVLFARAQVAVNFGRSASPVYHDLPGTNGRMTSMQAALLSVQLSRAEELLEARRVVTAYYRHFLPDSDHCQRQPERGGTMNAPWLHCVTVGGHRRRAVLGALENAGIEARPFFPVLSAHRAFPVQGERLRDSAQDISDSGICLPLWPGMSEQMVEGIANIVKGLK